MNQRPSGYEPDELPGCSTPRRENYYVRSSFKAQSKTSLSAARLRRRAASITMLAWLQRFLSERLVGRIPGSSSLGIRKRCARRIASAGMRCISTWWKSIPPFTLSPIRCLCADGATPLRRILFLTSNCTNCFPTIQRRRSCFHPRYKKSCDWKKMQKFRSRERQARKCSRHLRLRWKSFGAQGSSAFCFCNCPRRFHHANMLWTNSIR